MRMGTCAAVSDLTKCKRYQALVLDYHKLSQPMNRQALHTLKPRIKGISTANLSCSESLPWFMMKTGTLCNSTVAWLGVKWVYIVYFHSLLKRPALDFCDSSWPVVPWEWEMDPGGNEPFEVDSGDTWTKVVRGWVDSGHRAGNAVEPVGFLLQIEELVTSQWMRLQSKSGQVVTSPKFGNDCSRHLFLGLQTSFDVHVTSCNIL